MTAAPTGRQYELLHGAQRAVVVEMGAGLREYGTDSVPFVDGYGVEQEPDGGRGQLLLPWPNRIAGAEYRFEGEEFSVGPVLAGGTAAGVAAFVLVAEGAVIEV